MSRCIALTFLIVVVATAPGSASSAEGNGAAAAFLKDHCGSCHTGKDAQGGLDLDSFRDGPGDAESVRRWIRIHDRVELGEMPPKDEPRPDRERTRKFLSELGASLNRAESALRQRAFRRLNRIEYENTIRDLFGIRVDLRDMLPADPTAHGFDTVSDVRSLSPEQMEIYLQAADKALAQAFGPDKEPKRVAAKMPLGQDKFASRSIGQLFVKTDDDSLVTFQGGWCPSVFLSGQAKADGTYRVRIQAKAYQTDKPLVMAVYGGDVIVGRQPSHLVGYYDVKPGDEWTVVTFEDFLETSGCYQMKPYRLFAPTQGPERFKGPGLMIGEVEVEGPLEAWPPPSREKLLGKLDVKAATLDDARAVFARLLPRAYRRRTTPEDSDLYVEVTRKALEEVRSFEDALRVGLKAVLCSPEFLLREESADTETNGGPQWLNDHALASRLSYFLWSSMPDDELLKLADESSRHAPRAVRSEKRGTGRPTRSKNTEAKQNPPTQADGTRSVPAALGDPDILRDQVERMLRDPKADRFVKNFTGQWLKLREIDFTEPDARQYPEFDEMLRHSMLEEIQRYFHEVLDRDLPLTEFIESDWAILNERLAAHYGIEGVTGQSFRRVTLPPGHVRGGLLTQASVLKVTANGTNTSPVVRGTWLLDNILGRPVPTPPPGVGSIEPDIRGATTVREQLAKHRQVESCATCHKHIDPPGFALESFDAIGGWRDWYRSLGKGDPVNLEIGRRRVQYKKGPAVDPSGTMPDGREFDDIRTFKRLLLEDKNQLARCLTEKLLIYGLGRKPGFADRAEVEEIVSKAREKGYGFRALIHEVVQSDLFRQR